MNSRFAVIDFETTGLSPENGDRITEVAIVIVESGKIVDQFESLVNTGKSIPFHIQNLTGITNQMTANAPPATVIIPKIHQYIKDSTLVAHNAKFDSKFFHSEMQKIGVQVSFDFVCTLLLSRRLYPLLDNYRLSSLAKYHGIKSQGKSHRALADALITAELFIKISDDLKDLLYENTLTSYHYLNSQKQPLSFFAKNKKLLQTERNEPKINKIIVSQEKLIQENQLKESDTNQLSNSSTKSIITNKTVEINSKQITDQSVSEYIQWQKTKTGLIHKRSGAFIPFVDTLRDAFPVSGYQVKNHPPFIFIKDSEIENIEPVSTNLVIDVTSEPMKKLITFFKPKQPKINHKSQESLQTVKVTNPQNGFGQTTFSNGDQYEGYFDNGKRHGQGIYRWPNDSFYEGEWLYGEMTGIGKKVFSDGGSISGSFLNGELNGLGIQIFSSSGEWKGDKYEGEFVKGIREGLGTYTWSNGTTYVGKWLAGKMHGNGLLSWSNGDTHEGNFVNGLRHGRGIFTSSSGEEYSGVWLAGKFDRECAYRDKNGNSYKGGFQDYHFHGYGTFTWKNGAKYEGAFFNGLRQGNGTFTSSSRKKYFGHWKSGLLIDAYDDWIEKQAAKFSTQYRNLKALKELSLTYIRIRKNLNQTTNLNQDSKSEYEKLCQSLENQLDLSLADFDAAYDEFYIDIEECFFCCFESSYKDQITNRFEDRIKHITALRNELYKTYVELIDQKPF